MQLSIRSIAGSRKRRKYAIFSGFSHSSLVRIAREEMEKRGIELVCAYEREPRTKTKQKYLTLFDRTLNIKEPRSLQELRKMRSEVALVTCTQERDMSTHIRTLLELGRIDASGAEKYEMLMDKHRFKEYLRQHAREHAIPSMSVDATSYDTFDESCLPGVIKPTGLAGSSYIKTVATREEAVDFLQMYSDRMMENGDEYYNRQTKLLIEKFIDGPQYSVNAYIDEHGEPTLCPIMRVIPAYALTEKKQGGSAYSAIQYTTHELSRENCDSLTRAVQKVADAFEIRSTSVHFDSVLQDTEWKFFEVGLRIGGLRQKVYEHSHGFNHFRNDLLNRLGEKPDLGKEKRHVGLVQTASERSGILKKISYSRTITIPGSARVLEDRLAKLGEKVSPVSTGGATITRHFVVGRSEEEVARTCYGLQKSIVLEVEDTV